MPVPMATAYGTGEVDEPCTEDERIGSVVSEVEAC
jgi:hypothetical protein